MKKSTWADVQASMRLSKLRPGTVKEDTLVEEFEQVVAYFDCLQKVDTDGVRPMVQPTLVRVDELREDRARRVVEREGWLDSAPETDGDFIVVPKVM